MNSQTESNKPSGRTPARATKPTKPAVSPLEKEAALLLLAAWAQANRLPMASGSIHGKSATFHVRTTEDGDFRLTIEPKAWEEMERLERRRRVEADLAQAIADQRASVHFAEILEDQARQIRRAPEEVDAEGYLEAKRTEADAAVRVRSATKELSSIQREEEASQSLEFVFPPDLANLEFGFRFPEAP